VWRITISPNILANKKLSAIGNLANLQSKEPPIDPMALRKLTLWMQVQRKGMFQKVKRPLLAWLTYNTLVKTCISADYREINTEAYVPNRPV